MLLNSNSDNSNFSLIQTFFSVLWPTNALANWNLRTFSHKRKETWRQILDFYINCDKISFSLWPKSALANWNLCTFTVTNGKKHEDKYLIFTLIVISFSLLSNFASPEKWSMQGIYSPSPSPKFTLLPVTSTRQQFSLLACRKYETVLVKRADLPLERCPTTLPYLSTATAYLSYSFSDSGWGLTISPFLEVHFVT